MAGAVLAISGIAAATFFAGAAFGKNKTVPPGVQQRALPSARVTVYGDSLVSQAVPYLRAVGTVFGLDVTAHSFYGTAPCDFLPVVRRDLQGRRTDVVVWAFSGNSIGTCMRDHTGRPLTGAAIISKYSVDTMAAAASAEAAGVRFVLVSPPAARSVGNWSGFDSMYRGLAATDPRIDYVDGGIEIAPDGHFMDTQSCLPFETELSVARGACARGDQILVRASDGVHFCPVSKQLTCPVYSSGALRYALAILGAVRLDVDYRYEQGGRAPITSSAR
jgi:hypothetical protein